MKKLFTLICAGVLMSALGVAFSACDKDGAQDRAGLGEEIPGIAIVHATGTVIGYWADTGYGCLFVDVDEKYPIGEPVEYHCNVDPKYTELSGDYHNVIQVQHVLPVKKIGDRISFSVRKYLGHESKDYDLFLIGTGIQTMEHTRPSVPRYVVTTYEILKN